MENNNIEKIKQIHIKLDERLHHALKLEAAYHNTTIQDLVVELISKKVLVGEFSNMIMDKK